MKEVCHTTPSHHDGHRESELHNVFSQLSCPEHVITSPVHAKTQCLHLLFSCGTPMELHASLYTRIASRPLHVLLFRTSRTVRKPIIARPICHAASRKHIESFRSIHGQIQLEDAAVAADWWGTCCTSSRGQDNGGVSAGPRIHVGRW